jgi:serine/threonine-protein kinase RsbW
MESIKKRAVFANLEEVLDFVEVKITECGLSLAKVPDIVLTVEELLVNIISYAFPNEENGDMKVMCGRKHGYVIVKILDKGVPFDATAAKEPDISTHIHERKIGGMGIFLAKNIVDEMSYKRTFRKNILTIKKKIE